MSKSTPDKIRVYALAKELKLENKQVLELCQELGFSSITNQLHGLDPVQVESVRKRLKDGPKQSPATPPPASAPAKAPVIPPPSVTGTKVRTLPPPKPKPAGKNPEPQDRHEVATPDVEPAQPVAEPALEEVAPEPTPTPVVPANPEPEAPVKVVPPPPAPLPPPTVGNRNLPNLTAHNRPPVIRGAAGRPVAPPPAPRPAPEPEASVSGPAAEPEPKTEVVPHSVATVEPVDVKPAPAVEPEPEPVAKVTPPEPTPPEGEVEPPAPTRRPAPMPTPRAPLPAIQQGTGNRLPNLGTPGNRPGQSGQGPRPPQPQGPGGPRPPQPQQQGPGGSRPPQPAPQGPGMQGGPRPQHPAPQPGPPQVPPRGSGQFPPPRVGPPGPGFRGAPQGGPGGPSQGPTSGGSGTIGGPFRPGMQGQGPAGPGRAPAPSVTPKGQVRLTPEQIAKLREAEKRKGGKVEMREVQRVVTQPTPEKPGITPPPADDRGGPRSTSAPGRGRPAGEDEDRPKRPGEVAGRDTRTKHRNRDRGGKGPTDKGSIIIGEGGTVDVIEQAAGSRKGPRAALLAKLKRQQQKQAVKKEGPVEITLPITVRSLSEAIGMKVGELSKQLLKETQQLYGANSQVDFEVAELIAIGKGITLVAKKVETREDMLLRRFKEQAEQVEEDKLRLRPPIVTIMGHVDHGKTSLLDKIRQEYGLSSDVVSTEAGGITQVIRAWRVEKDGKPVTFLDTPGHEAFTKMRARGAKVTDIAVIVVAATDGVMPQTEEAISHAKAADVEIIVAINKIDMPNANVDRTRRQLYSLGLLPDNMGGDVPFVETSAVTGEGIGELLDSIAIVAELADLKADPEHKPSGTCLEAYMEGDRGVMATLIVQQGTLHKGDVILCGSSYGRVRAMYNDLGMPIDAAGPSTPVKVYGLDDVPDADDPFYFVNDIAEAREIAEMRKQRQIEAARTSMAPKSLDALKEANARAKITELKVVLKAEARGSVEAIKKELEKLVHEEVRCRVLHSGIGAITESDVTLALTSPADTLIIGFNVTADDAALRLAEERGISIREYDIIYKLTDDVKAALEGRLKPIEEVVHLGRAVVRETFKITKVGTIAGCYVTSGVLERSARVRVIREGTVIFPPSEKTIGLDSLKRFKDDAKEVREGFECGLKIAGFDDIKVGDVIEAFRIEVRQRTL